jgi:hypothetical protein
MAKLHVYFRVMSITFVFECNPRIIRTPLYFTLKFFDIFCIISLLAFSLTGGELQKSQFHCSYHP